MPSSSSGRDQKGRIGRSVPEKKGANGKLFVDTVQQTAGLGQGPDKGALKARHLELTALHLVQQFGQLALSDGDFGELHL